MYLFNANMLSKYKFIIRDGCLIKKKITFGKNVIKVNENLKMRISLRPEITEIYSYNSKFKVFTLS